MTTVLDALGTLSAIRSAVNRGFVDTRHGGVLPALPSGWTPAGAVQTADAGTTPALLLLPVVRYDGFPAWMHVIRGEADGLLRRRLAAELTALDATLLAVSAAPSGAALLRWLDRAGPKDRHPYLVCARPGPTFADDLARGPLAVDRVLKGLLAGIDAVSALHAHGRSHGQLSPWTMHHDGEAVRLSPPLPSVLAEMVRLAGGTGHEPPEVLRGGENDIAADVFALASTGWTLLGGRAPYGALGDSLARLTAREPVSLPRTDLPDGLESALRSALSPDPAHRPDVRTLQRALQIAAGRREDAVIVDPDATVERQDTLAPTRPLEETGQPLGSRYMLDSLIGRGATGHVWRGHVRGTSARIAVKLLRPELAEDPEVVTRFMRERATLMRVQHPNLVAVQDLVAEGGALAIVMDLVDGRDLRNTLGRGPLQPADGARILAQTVSALSAVHAAGIVHRDLKPENILLDRADGRLRARLTDFGLARAVDSSVLTRGSQLIGTPAYVAPEIVAGRPAAPPADVYAFGITAYETLSGRRPFVAESTAGLLRAHLDEAPTRPQGMDDHVWDLISACLRKDPASRPDTASLTVAWWRVANDEPVDGTALLRSAAPADPVASAPARETDDASVASAPARETEDAPTPLRYGRHAAAAPSDGTEIQETTGAQRPLAAPQPRPPASRTPWRRWGLIAAVVIVGGFGAGFAVAALRGGGGGGSPTTSPNASVGYPLAARVVISNGAPFVQWTVPAGLATDQSVIVVSRVARDGRPGQVLPPGALKASQQSQVESDLAQGDCVVVYMYGAAKTPASQATATPACVPRQ